MCSVVAPLEDEDAVLEVDAVEAVVELAGVLLDVAGVLLEVVDAAAGALEVAAGALLWLLEEPHAATPTAIAAVLRTSTNLGISEVPFGKS